MYTIALLGGTFDPVHNGHIKASLCLQSHFNFDAYFFLPCKASVLKPSALASNQQRVEMLQLALKPFPQFQLDLREIERDTPSYMVDTLSSFRAEYKNSSITLILGYDAFLSLPQWHQWEKLLELANLLVINRNPFASISPTESIKELTIKHRTLDKTNFLSHKAGLIYFFDAGNYEISSTEIRKAIHSEGNKDTKLPPEVYQYINQWQLYQ